jgi:hypothetical protein
MTDAAASNATPIETIVFLFNVPPFPKLPNCYGDIHKNLWITLWIKCGLHLIAHDFGASSWFR